MSSRDRKRVMGWVNVWRTIGGENSFPKHVRWEEKKLGEKILLRDGGWAIKLAYEGRDYVGEVVKVFGGDGRATGIWRREC